MTRDPALEAAIIAAPDDAFARRVYGDWLAQQGGVLGDWIAIAAACEAAPGDARLAAARVASLAAHATALLGPRAKAILPHAVLGWSGGFLDSIRLQPVRAGAATQPPRRALAPADLTALLAQPLAAAVRTIALGNFERAADRIVAALAAAAPRALATLVAVDTVVAPARPVDLDPIVEACAGSLRRLGLRSVGLTARAPHVTEVVAGDAAALAWLVRPDSCPALAHLTITAGSVAPAVLEALLAHHRLATLRLVGTHDVAKLVPVLRAAHVPRVELAHVGPVRAPPGVAVVGGACTLVDHVTTDPDGTSWIAHHLADAALLALVPGAGVPCYQIGTNRILAGDFAGGLPFLAHAVALPSAYIGSMAWANAAIAHEKLGQLDRAAQLAREALLHAPREPNFYAILLDALRRTDRLADALAELPRAEAALAARARAQQAGPAAEACLLDLALCLAQAGRPGDVLALPARYPDLVTPDLRAVLALAHLAQGDRAAAAAALAADATAPVVHHARAALALPDTAAALDHLRALRRAGYTEWHWVAVDPLLAPLRTDPVFAKLVSSARA